jgi:hypothetical protein
MSDPGSLRVVISRSGGFAAIRRQYSVDVADMAPVDAARLRELVVDFDRLATQEPVPPGPPDSFQYEITIEQGGEHRTLHAGEGSALQPLIDFVRDQQPGERGSGS